MVESEGPGSQKVKGPGPPGTYKWFVVYWGGFGGIARPTHWQVRVKHDGKVERVPWQIQSLNERSKIYTLKVDSARGKAPAPGRRRSVNAASMILAGRPSHWKDSARDPAIASISFVAVPPICEARAKCMAVARPDRRAIRRSVDPTRRRLPTFVIIFTTRSSRCDRRSDPLESIESFQNLG